jgi:hypothetical protein
MYGPVRSLTIPEICHPLASIRIVSPANCGV